MTPEAVISECLRFHGWGERFARTDGLELDWGRRLKRGEYLVTRRDVRPEHVKAIRRAEVTPGMKKSDVTAAWLLTHEEVRDVYGHVARVGGTTYAYFTGFDVGRRYALCLIGDLVVGVKPCDEVLIRRDRGLEMEVARHYLGYVQFFETSTGEPGGRTVDLNDCDYDTWIHGLYSEGVVPPYSTDPEAAADIEREVRLQGRFDEYARALEGFGADIRSATPAERCRAAVAVAARHAGEERG